ncbi:hypothetical protein ACIQ9J_35635 [Streptomyces sp. NPDC094153]|uniref:hypothetical protein n=1 Tax=Streptomyces sp. NPDC094153 TaxID=3366058 RepID=UPI0038006D60
MEDHPSEAEQSAFGQMSTLSDVREVAEAIIGVLSDLFIDHEPKTESEQRVVFVVSASLERGGTGVDEIDRVLREKYLGFDERPRAGWEVEISFDEVVDLAQVLVASKERPDTQIARSSTLEMIVRDETPHSAPTAATGTRTVHKVQTSGGECTVTVGPPSADLLLCLVLRLSGFERLAVFDRQRLFGFLMEQEQQRGLTEGATARVSARRLLNVMAQPELLSLRLKGPRGVDRAELERLATAFRVRLAYESDVVLAPVLDVNRLDKSPSQPRFIRQLHFRAPEFVEAIGQGTPTGFMGDRLLGRPTVADEELSLRYLRAIAATDPFAAFMGYYHVLEYQMEDAWFDSLHKRVATAGGALQRPADDIRSAASAAARLLGIREKEVRFTELRALQALLESRLDLHGLTADLSRHHDGAVDYFAAGGLPFVEVQQLDLTSTQDSAGRMRLKGEIARRIYTVRCAITHSKASSSRYSPYTDDLYLGREIPLVRIAAEQLLIPADQRF